MKRLFCFTILIAAVAPATHAGSLDGRWDATVTIGGAEIPFRIDFAGQGKDFTATLFDGDQKVTSTSGKFENGEFTAKYEHYLTTLNATEKNGELDGKLEGRFGAREISI